MTVPYSQRIKKNWYPLGIALFVAFFIILVGAAVLRARQISAGSVPDGVRNPLSNPTEYSWFSLPEILPAIDRVSA